MNSETILIVDDEPLVREFCWSTLARAGYQVLQAATAEQALEVWSKNRQLIDLALVDVVMPGMSGLGLVKRLNQQEPQLKIALMSGYSPDEVKGLIGTEGGNCDLFWKPFSTKAFLQMIRNLLDRPRLEQGSQSMTAGS